MNIHYKNIGASKAESLQKIDFNNIKTAKFTYQNFIDWTENQHNNKFVPIINLMKTEIESQDIKQMQRMFVNFSMHLKMSISNIIEDIISFRINQNRSN